MRLTQYSSNGNHGCDCLQDDVLYSGGFSDIFVDAVVSFASRLVGYFCSYYIYIIPIPPLYNVLCNARNCFTISLWSPWRQGLQQEFSSRSEEKFENKRASKFWRQGTIWGNEILLQVATNKLQLFSPKSVTKSL